MKLSNKRKALLIGCGSIGSYHCQALQACKYEVDIYDVDQRKACLFGQRWLARAIDLSSIDLQFYDILVLAIPNHLRRDWIEKLSTENFSGKVVIEKPVALTLSEMDDLSGLRVWCPYVRAAGLLKTSGIIGTKELRSSIKTYGATAPLVDLLPHHISVFCYLSQGSSPRLKIDRWDINEISLISQGFSIKLGMGEGAGFYFVGDCRATIANKMSKVFQPAGFMWFFNMVSSCDRPPLWMTRASQLTADLCEMSQ